MPTQTPSKAKEIHYNHPWSPGSPRCGTNHGKVITLTTHKGLVTCDICKFHLGLYVPENYTPLHPSEPVMEQLTLFGT